MPIRRSRRTSSDLIAAPKSHPTPDRCLDFILSTNLTCLSNNQPLAKSYRTPQWLFDQYNQEFHFTAMWRLTLPTPSAPNIILFMTTDWRRTGRRGEVVWCNPPWSGLRLWVEKAHAESLKGVTTVTLAPCRTETSYWHNYVIPFAEVRWIRGISLLKVKATTSTFPAA